MPRGRPKKVISEVVEPTPIIPEIVSTPEVKERSAEYLRVQKVYEVIQKTDPKLWERDKEQLLAKLEQL